MKRREFILSTAAALPAASSLAATGVDPVVPLFERWTNALRTWEAYTRQPIEAIDPATDDALWLEREAHLDALIATNATTPHGVLCQALALWEEEGPIGLVSAGREDYGTKEHRLLQRLILSLEAITATAPQPAIRKGCWSVADF